MKDSQQAATFDAQVRIGSASSEIAARTTETSGVIDFHKIPCRSWTVQASKTGFEDRETTIQIAGGANAELNIVLEPTILRTTTEVSDVASPVAKASSQTTELCATYSSVAGRAQ